MPPTTHPKRKSWSAPSWSDGYFLSPCTVVLIYLCRGAWPLWVVFPKFIISDMYCYAFPQPLLPCFIMDSLILGSICISGWYPKVKVKDWVASRNLIFAANISLMNYSRGVVAFSSIIFSCFPLKRQSRPKRGSFISRTIQRQADISCALLLLV